MSALHRNDSLFNTSIESGLRTLFVLEAVKPHPCDLQRLVIYDYLLIHSHDAAAGPESLHPPTPLRSGELLVRRKLVEDGLHLLLRKGLVNISYTKAGLLYTTTKIAEAFLPHLNSPYAKRCAEISKWIAKQFQSLSDDALNSLVNENIGRWGAEFTHEPMLLEEVE